MKSLMRRIDMFCYRHPKFGIKNLMLYIVIGNVLCYVLSLMDTAALLFFVLPYNAVSVFKYGEVWRLITFIFVPTNLGIGSLPWFVLSTYFYYLIGNALEAEWGRGKFTIYYLSGMILSIICGLIIWLGWGLIMQFITAYYLNLSLILVFATLFPNAEIRLFALVPIRAKWLGWAVAALLAYYAFKDAFPFNLLIPFMLANYLIFCGGWLFDFLRPSRVRAKSAQVHRTIDFKTTAKKFNREQAKMPYTRRCEVCGRTDADNPELEFRFCSRCGGYHCFCIEHINNHVHFTE